MKLIQYQYYKIIYILIVSITFNNDFFLNTDLGECHVRGVSENHVDIVEEIIINYAKDVNNTFFTIKSNPYSIYLAKDLDDFYNESGKSTPKWAFAITRKNPNRIIMQYPRNINSLKKVLIHELNHIYINNLRLSHTIPSWFKEGMAVSESGEFSINHMVVFSTAKWSNQLFSINQLSNFKSVNKSNSKLAYAQSYIMFKALQEYYGSSIYGELIAQIDQGKSFWKALVHITGDNQTEIHNKINEFVEEKYSWMFLFNRFNLIFMFLPLILILGYIYKRYKNRQLLEKWELEELLEDLHKDDEPN